MFTWLADNWEGIMIACFIVSEIMGLFKSIPINGWADAIKQMLLKLAGK